VSRIAFAHDLRLWFKRVCAKLLQWSAIEVRAAFEVDSRRHPVRGVSRVEKLWLAAVLLAAVGWIIFRLLQTPLALD